jgi:signal transduction histidine kinase
MIGYRLIFFILFVTTISWSQKDSLRVAQLLDSALLNPARSASFLEKVDFIEKRNQGLPAVLADVMALKVKFELRKGNVNASKQIVDKAKRKFKTEEALFAVFLSLEGSVFATERSFQEAISSYQRALRMYDDLKMEREAAYVKNNIANVFFNLNDFESAHKYASESFETVFNLKDTLYYPQIAAILSISETKTKRFASAKKHADLAVTAGQTYKNPVAIILGKYALGDIYGEELDWEKAKIEYTSVVTMSEQMHLLQYELFGRIGLLATAVAQKHYDDAILQGEKALTIIKTIGINYADYTIYQQLSLAYHELGNDEKAYNYLNKANTAFRSYNTLENKKAIQELLTKYETEKKERALSLKELELSRAVLVLFILLFAVSTLIARVFWVRKRNENRILNLQVDSTKREVEAYVEGEQRERERIAADIHDGIASSLTGLALKIEQGENRYGTEMISNQIQQIRDEVRLISKNMLPFNLKEEGWNAAFKRLIDTIQTSSFQFFFLADYNEQLLNNQRGMVVYRILQELVQNTQKHAQATECELLITEENNELLIQYSDNGKGGAEDEILKGNGWQSILTRLAAIDGCVTFPENPLGGLKIDLHLNKK